MVKDAGASAGIGGNRCRRAWLKTLGEAYPLIGGGELKRVGRLQRDTLKEFQSLVGARSVESWARTHVPHSRALRGIGKCGFVTAVLYFATGERVVLDELGRQPAASARSLACARRRWRFFAQREMEAQCVGCKRICALVKFPDEGLSISFWERRSGNAR